MIAAVNGAAVGWGMELALMADIRVASEKAKFGELFVLRGLCTDVAGIGRLAQLVGREKAAELLFTGDVIDAAEALRIGLVGRVVPHDELLPTALGAGRQRIAANPPLAVAEDQGAGCVGRSTRTGTSSARGSARRLAELFQTEDHREGVEVVPREALPEIHRELTLPLASLDNRCFAHPGGALRRSELRR